MFGFLREVASTESCQAAVGVCNRVLLSLQPPPDDKVESISAWRLHSLDKCDSSYSFAIYVDRSKTPIFYVVYVPRLLNILRTNEKQVAESLQSKLLESRSLVNSLESLYSETFTEKMEHLRSSLLNNSSFNDIHHAAACGFTELVENYCSGKCSNILVNERTSDGQLPLQIAIKNGHVKTVEVLLIFGASISEPDFRNRNAVHYAAKSSVDILEILSSSPIFSTAMDKVDDKGMSPLCLAIFTDNVDCVEFLLSHECSTGPFKCGPLVSVIIAARGRNHLPRMVDLIVERDPNFLAEQINGSGTILHENLDSELLYHILMKHSESLNFNARNAKGETALFCSVKRNELHQAILLGTSGVDPNIADLEGNTALHFAVENDRGTFVKLLLCLNASVKQKNDKKLTPIDLGRSNSTLMNNLNFSENSPPSEPQPENVLSQLMQDHALKERTLLKSKGVELINCLSLDGGGMRGVILVQILLHIKHALGSPVMRHFKWLAGTSTGAITALALAKGERLERCLTLYMKFKDEVFVGTKPYGAKSIEKFYQSYFGNSRLMSEIGPKRVMVAAASIRTNPSVLKLFRNYTLPLSKTENDSLGFPDPRENLVWKCARYSSAAPMFFPLKDGFIDGGLMANNPTMDLLADIHMCNAACIKKKLKTSEIGCILSLGTGVAPVETYNSEFNLSMPRGLTDGINMVINFKDQVKEMLKFKDILIQQITSSDGECVKRARSWVHDQKILYFRFSPPLDRAVELDENDNETLVDLLWSAEKYLRTTAKADVEMLVNYLKM